MVRLPKPKPSQRPSADEVPSASAHSTTDSGRPSHSDSPSRSAAARGWIAVGGGSVARITSSSPKVRSSRVLSDDGLITSRGLVIGQAPRLARERDGCRRGRSGRQPQAARQSKFLRTLIRHFLSLPAIRLPASVIAPAVAALLVPAVRFAEPLAVGRLPAPLAAVDLSAIAAP